MAIQHNPYEQESRSFKPLQASRAGKSVMPPPIMNENEVVQRAVGFEIELDYNPYWNEEHMDELNKGRVFPKDSKFPMFKKGDVLLKGDGFELQTDISYDNFIPYLELVTDPFEESLSGYHRMGETMMRMMSFMEEVYKEARIHWYNFRLPAKAKAFGNIPPKFENLVFKLGRGSISSGLFQATAGISLSAISDIFEDLAEPRAEESEELKQKRKEGRKFLIDWQEDVEYDEDYLHNARAFRHVADVVNDLQMEYGFDASLAGLLKMIGQYFIMGNERMEKYPKSMPSILARTDFSCLFEEATKSCDSVRIQSIWMSMIESLNDRLNIGPLSLPLYRHGIYLAKKCKKYYSGKERLLDVMTRERWAMKIAQGRDELTEAFFPVPEAKEELESMGAMGNHLDNLDPLGLEKVPVFELRGFTHKLPYSIWGEFAHTIFKWVVAKNKGKQAFFNDNETCS
ncbi:hypothetical protein [Aureibacter tunicatorum]|uniref:Uncharacterized protein n=1 Tax=Aureibacter tunicatorum TaxID=866807 RepID=A0AAE3XND3_9BACT|nr:hypothetical protein [Aureibacter tunicatorum]MDR6238249.1 hypothetical protein [Aureibacter tunicatorum]BDD03282.1 hypothetical protein AUTU_07650 [Aureibacter tunicatorum]